MKIGFIGSGNVASALGLYLQENHQEITGYYDLDEEKSKDVAQRVGAKVFLNLGDLVKKSQLIVIAVNDDSIQSVVKALEDLRLEAQWREKILVHTSGLHTYELLKPLMEKGCEGTSLHPMQAFADLNASVQKLKNTYFTMDNKSTRVQALLEEMGQPYFMIAPEHKAQYHLAAVVTSNFFVTLVHYALTLYEDIGLERKEAFQAMQPLLESSFENIMALGPIQGLTGPIKRGDSQTVACHMKALEEKEAWLKLYIQLAKENLTLANASNIQVSRQEIEAILGQKERQLWQK